MEVFFDVSWNGDIKYSCLVFPVQCNFTVEAPCLLLCDLIFFLDFIYNMLGILFSLVFYAKAVYHQLEGDYVPVVPK